MGRAKLGGRKPPLWPWLLGLVVLALALWGVAEILDSQGEVRDPAGLTTTPGDVPDPVVVPAPANE